MSRHARNILSALKRSAASVENYCCTSAALPVIKYQVQPSTIGPPNDPSLVVRLELPLLMEEARHLHYGNLGHIFSRGGRRKNFCKKERAGSSLLSVAILVPLDTRFC